MRDRTTEGILRSAIARWVAEAEATLQRAAHERREAIDFGQRFEEICAKLPTASCPFCGGAMTDTGPLREFAEDLAYARQWMYQGEEFCLHCRTCGTSSVSAPPRNSAQVWDAGETTTRGTTFAAALFRTFPSITVVALEGATGRGWLIQLNDVWYANAKTKSELAALWGVR